MANLCIVGLQWGDEGKGKIVDILAAEFDIVARYQGGSNAGHTVLIGKEKFVLHQVPTGILRNGKDCVIGNGVALDPVLLVQEISDLRAHAVQVGPNLHISDRAHVVMPYHKMLDGLDGRRLRGPRIGTTHRGIGPCYEDKMGRLGLRVAELCIPQRFKERLRQNLKIKNRILAEVYGLKPLKWQTIYEEYLPAAEELRPYVCDTAEFLRNAMKRGKTILFEGAQGALLDVDFGTYPYVTSSSAGPGGAVTGLGIAPKDVSSVMGVMKAYITRVGEGPFPTEAEETVSQRIREKANEYGATTGRPRRCGWFDAVAVRHACRLNGADSIALTKLDALSGEKAVKVCVGYRSNGTVMDTLPADAASLSECQPVYERFPGWREDVSGARTTEELPRNARNYVAALERAVGVPISAISLGPEREQTILREGWNGKPAVRLLADD
jgi:adenylosuccinate synthase